MEHKKKLLRYDEVAVMLSCSLRHVFWLVEEDELERVYIGQGRRGARITAQSVEAYIERIRQRNGSHLHPP